MDSTACLRPVGSSASNPLAISIGHAGAAAEMQAAYRQRGKPSKCCRGLGMVSPGACVAMFRGGEPTCARDGGCSMGRIEDARQPKEKEAVSRYGACIVCGRKGNINAAGVCYKPSCRETVAQEQISRHIDKSIKAGPVIDRHNQPTILSPVESEALVSVLERDPHVTLLTDETLPDLTPEPMELAVGLGAAREVIDASLDTSRPFVLDGIEFEPVTPKRPMGSCSVCIRRDTIGISTAAERQFGLQPYSHASYTVSRDGLAVALMFYGGPRDEAVTVQRNKGALSISSTPLGRKHPELVGKRTVLQPTEVPGCFIARFDGEAA